MSTEIYKDNFLENDKQLLDIEKEAKFVKMVGKKWAYQNLKSCLRYSWEIAAKSMLNWTVKLTPNKSKNNSTKQRENWM